MENYTIISDSACDFPQVFIEKFNIDLVYFYVSFDKQNYLKEIKEIAVKDFHNKLIETGIFPKTSLPTPQDYIEVMEKHLKNGEDIICLCITSKFSGSYQSAVNAKNILHENYPERKIEVIDSIQATGGQGLILYELCKMREAGLSFDETVNRIQELKQSARIFFTLDSLDYLQKGGRIGKVSSLAGAILNIKPIICLKDGELVPIGKVRGKKKSISEIINYTVKEIGENKEKYELCLLTAVRFDEAIELQKILRNEYGLNVLEEIAHIGVTIGTHTGPTPIAICLIKKFDM